MQRASFVGLQHECPLFRPPPLQALRTLTRSAATPTWPTCARAPSSSRCSTGECGGQGRAGQGRASAEEHRQHKELKGHSWRTSRCSAAHQAAMPRQHCCVAVERQPARRRCCLACLSCCLQLYPRRIGCLQVRRAHHQRGSYQGTQGGGCAQRRACSVCSSPGVSSGFDPFSMSVVPPVQSIFSFGKKSDDL